jgi:hypothetical protein
MPTMAQAAPNSAAQQAMQECALMYCGPRNPSVMQQKSTLVESCFRQKTGRTPAELGISLPSLRCCPGSPCY